VEAVFSYFPYKLGPTFCMVILENGLDLEFFPCKNKPTSYFMEKINLESLHRFYLPLMEYEGSIGLVMRKMKKKIADFHFLGLFMNKYHDLSDKKISVCHAPLPPVLDKICLDATELTLKARKLKLWLPKSFVST
jgi:hypothetical protein